MKTQLEDTPRTGELEDAPTQRAWEVADRDHEVKSSFKSGDSSDRSRNFHRDPITGEPGSHPLGTGLGAVGAAAAGAAIGSIGGPVGAAVGGVIGAVVGGVIGHEVAEGFDPTPEDAFWRDNYHNEPYFNQGLDYGDYEPAYRMGYESYTTDRGRPYDEVESELGEKWSTTKGDSRLEWEQAKLATRAAWHRAEQSNYQSPREVR